MMLFGYEILAQLNPIHWNPRRTQQFETGGINSHKCCLSWETIRIPQWDWKSESPLCWEGGEIGTEITRTHC